MFLRNYWYVAAYDHEIGRCPLGRIILGEPIVFYRLEDGTPVALEDRCAHRHLPLSMGTLVGDVLQCHYHGLRYDKTGTCVRVPGQDTIPRSARVKNYPVVERYHWLWIWMGDPALADPDKITDFHWFDDPNWGAKGEYLHVKGNWQLVVDNLLDLTHLAFVHGTTIGNPALVNQAQVKVQRAAAADLREGGRLHRQRGSLADHQFHAAGVFAPRRRRHADRHRRARGETRGRHRHVESQRHHAGDGDHEPLFLGPGAQLRRRQSEDDRDADRADQDGVPRGRRGVRGATAQSAAHSQPAADRHQRRRRRDPGAPHSRPALSRGAGGGREDGGGGIRYKRAKRIATCPQAAAAGCRDRARKRYSIAALDTNSRKSPDKLRATCKLVTPLAGRAPACCGLGRVHRYRRKLKQVDLRPLARECAPPARGATARG